MLKKRFFKTKEEAEVTFEYMHPDAEAVALVAEFNQWQPLTMQYSKKDHTFRTKLRLPKNSEFHFRYLINDEQWDNDHQADAYVANDFGTDNSVVSTYLS
ncbi:isoamylase early set domain-containing protein [Pseudoalteromonas sp. BDTF-M6]|uniref:isoamylase early set domain-containing protein n=1 Tax=Pseudoalteromonas sp. BDTF-M6 TaxID=2796132 RepID=UPI001BB0D35F|nr:isoamylase early set domain-containing protein [Pseudoalteromonas sp. BDTF-M6]MBS3796863.1 isoamylase early set domain-containing protein [Pseudoalteromonas sp. BDTF-M6]